MKRLYRFLKRLWMKLNQIADETTLPYAEAQKKAPRLPHDSGL
jgi:hypothetical protein